METLKMLKQVQGISFKTIGPFLVAELDEKKFKKIRASKHGMEHVLFGQKTESHMHDFPSFYKSSNLDVECKGKKYSLPEQALTLVLPKIDHSWVPKTESGVVGSIDYRHAKQVTSA